RGVAGAGRRDHAAGRRLYRPDRSRRGRRQGRRGHGSQCRRGAGPVAEAGYGAAAAPASGAFRQARGGAEGEGDRRQGPHPRGAVTGRTRTGPAAHGRRPPVPLPLLTGFLGAGKTTLLNRLVREPALAGTAVIINEFGEVGIDHLLVEHAEEGIIELS